MTIRKVRIIHHIIIYTLLNKRNSTLTVVLVLLVTVDVEVVLASEVYEKF